MMCGMQPWCRKHNPLAVPSAILFLSEIPLTILFVNPSDEVVSRTEGIPAFDYSSTLRPYPAALWDEVVTGILWDTASPSGLPDYLRGGFDFGDWSITHVLRGAPDRES